LQLAAQDLRPVSRRRTRGDLHVRKRRELPNSPRLELLGFDPDRPRQDPLGPVAFAQPRYVVDAVEQRHHDRTAQLLLRNRLKRRL
jgi:hypothetical protein